MYRLKCQHSIADIFSLPVYLIAEFNYVFLHFLVILCIVNDVVLRVIYLTVIVSVR